MSVELIQKIVDNLKAANIKYIISIDDNWKPAKREIDLNTDLMTFIDSHGIKLSDTVSRELRNESDIQSINDLLSSDNKLLKDLKNCIKEYVDSDVKIDPALDCLNTLFKEIQKRYPDIIIEKKHELFSDFSQYKENCLYILDKNMGEKEADVIVDNILKINKDSDSKNDIILIYSNESIKEYENNQSKLEYLESKISEEEKEEFYELLIYKMWAIGKSGDFDRLLPKVYRMLLNSLYGNVLYHVIRYKKNIEEKAYSDLIAIDTDELLNSIKDSFIEGDIIIHTLNRIYDGLKNKNEFESINDKYMQSIEALISYEHEEIKEEYNKIQNVSTEIANSQNAINKAPYENYRIMRLKQKLEEANSTNSISHHSIIDYTINRYYTDISTGDIFTFKDINGKSNYGMLISQACDCVIRIPNDDNIKHIDRLSKEMKMLLFKVEEIKSEIPIDKVKKLKKHISTYIWPVKIDGITFFFKPTEKIISLDDYILDLCSLNNDGKAKLNYDKESALKYKSFHSYKYFTDFKDKFFGSNSKFNKTGNLILNQYEREMTGLYNQARQEVACTYDCINSEVIQEPYEKLRQKIFEQTITIKYGILYKNEEFSLKRVGRLEPKRTLLIIQDMVSKLSRVGTDPVASISQENAV